jgi:hypothetical protein
MNPELVGRTLHVTSEPDAAGRWAFRSNAVGIETAHTWLQIAALLWGLDQMGVKAFIELGTWKGGLGALLLGGAVLGKFTYLGVENNRAAVDPDFGEMVDDVGYENWAALWFLDVFNASTIEGVRQRVGRANGPALIYCDDGDKPRELRTYAPVLRYGDYIAAHDYPSEVKPEDYEPLLPEYGLVEILPQIWREGIGIVMLRKMT